MQIGGTQEELAGSLSWIKPRDTKSARVRKSKKEEGEFQKYTVCFPDHAACTH